MWARLHNYRISGNAVLYMLVIMFNFVKFVQKCKDNRLCVTNESIYLFLVKAIFFCVGRPNSVLRPKIHIIYPQVRQTLKSVKTI